MLQHAESESAISGSMGPYSALRLSHCAPQNGGVAGFLTWRSAFGCYVLCLRDSDMHDMTRELRSNALPAGATCEA